MPDVITRQKLPGFAVVHNGSKVFVTEYANSSNGKLPVLDERSEKYSKSESIFRLVMSHLRVRRNFKDCLQIVQEQVPDFTVVYLDQGSKAPRLVFVPKNT